MLNIYRAVLFLALPVVVIRLLFRFFRSRQYVYRLPQRFGFKLNSKSSFKEGGIWIHAVSVGEVNAAVPLVKALQRDYPDKDILITTMTPTGSDRVEKNFNDEIHHCYLPYDYPGAVKRFLNTYKIGLAIVMETEIWPNFISECKYRSIPMMYVNVRMSKKSFLGYLKFKKLISPILKKVDNFAVQSVTDSERLVSLGADPDTVSVTGSIKFEIDVPASIQEAAQSVRRDLGWHRPVLIAGSTREGEESQILTAFETIKRDIPDLLLVIVPRHPERFQMVYKQCLRSGYSAVLRTQTTGQVDDDIDIYVGDTMGELSLLITSGDVAYIGGSLVPTGGHNLLEACAAGVPVVFGPHMFNFQEISNLVLEKGAGVQIMNQEELSDVVIKLVNDPILRDQYGSQGRELVEENKGALSKILNLLGKVLTE